MAAVFEWPQFRRRIAGLCMVLTLAGEIVAKAEWRGIISKSDSARIRATLADPERRTNKSVRNYLLVRLLKCGRCGEYMIARPRSGGLRRYACAKGPGLAGCGHTYIKADDLELFVRDAILHLLDSPQLESVLAGRLASEPDAERWQLEADDATTQLDELAQAYGNKQVTMAEWIAARKQIEKRLTSARKQLGKVSRTTVLDGYVGNADALREQWDSLDLTRQHAIVAALLDHVEVGPGRRGFNGFDDSRVRAVLRP